MTESGNKSSGSAFMRTIFIANTVADCRLVIIVVELTIRACV